MKGSLELLKFNSKKIGRINTKSGWQEVKVTLMVKPSDHIIFQKHTNFHMNWRLTSSTHTFCHLRTLVQSLSTVRGTLIIFISSIAVRESVQEWNGTEKRWDGYPVGQHWIHLFHQFGIWGQKRILVSLQNFKLQTLKADVRSLKKVLPTLDKRLPSCLSPSSTRWTKRYEAPFKGIWQV